MKIPRSGAEAIIASQPGFRLFREFFGLAMTVRLLLGSWFWLGSLAFNTMSKFVRIEFIPVNVGQLVL